MWRLFFSTAFVNHILAFPRQARSRDSRSAIRTLTTTPIVQRAPTFIFPASTLARQASSNSLPGPHAALPTKLVWPAPCNSMFGSLFSGLQRFYVFALKRLVGKFIKNGLDEQQLNVQLTRGVVELRNLELDCEVSDARMTARLKMPTCFFLPAHSSSFRVFA